MSVVDGISEIETCLNCKKRICDNCLERSSKIGKSKRRTYRIKDRLTGEVVAIGTSIECAAVLGIGNNQVRKNGKKGGTRKLVYEEV